MQTQHAYRFSAFQKQDIFHSLFSANPFCSIYTEPRNGLLKAVFRPIFGLSYKAVSDWLVEIARDNPNHLPGAEFEIQKHIFRGSEVRDAELVNFVEEICKYMHLFVISVLT